MTLVWPSNSCPRTHFGQNIQTPSHRKNGTMVSLFPIVAIFFIIVMLNYRNISISDNSAGVGSMFPSPFFYKAYLEELRTEHDHPAFRPLVISGPSGVGKGTLIQKLVEFYNQEVDWIDSRYHEDHHPLSFSVSHTTREPRPGEVEGIHYHFTTKEKILKDIKEDKFIEHAEVHGNIYGTSFESVQNVIQKGKICILDIDIQGAKGVKQNTSLIPPHFIFIAPPSIEILEKRLRDRGTETEEAIQRRMGNARRELEYGLVPGNFDDVVVNDDLESAFLHLRLILEQWYPHLNQVLSPSFEL